MSDLQKRVLKSEAALVQKEEENTALREQLKQFEERWSEYEIKMKSMEETWQKQMSSLQVECFTDYESHSHSLQHHTQKLTEMLQFWVLPFPDESCGCSKEPSCREHYRSSWRKTRHIDITFWL